jgi:hypothetical protein
MSKYNLRMKKATNYDENKYYDDLGIKENVKVFDDYYKQSLIKKIREKTLISNNVSFDMKPIVINEILVLSMEYIRNIGDSENFRLTVKNKINEMRGEKKMSRYKKKLNKYYLELDSMMNL